MDPAFAAILTEIVTGTRHYDTLEEGAHRRFAGGLFEDIEAAWEPVTSPDMHDIKFEGDPENPDGESPSHQTWLPTCSF